MTINFKKLDWADLVTYFSILPINNNISSKDLIDYFQFKRLDGLNLHSWVQPNYILETSLAKRILDDYGSELAFSLIDILFCNYREIFNKEFKDIRFGLYYFTSPKCGWILEKIQTEYVGLNSDKTEDYINRILAKNGNYRTAEENQILNDYFAKKEKA